jgi:Tol biopolymer transport system component
VNGSHELWDISPDGNTAMVATGGEANLDHTVWTVPILGGAPRHIGDFQDAEFASDGSIFAINLDGDIYQMKGDGTSAKKLASPGHGTVEPHFSPDGKVIRFQRDEQNSVLFEMSPDGSGIHRLLKDWPVKGDQWGGRWTRDGKYYLFLNRDNPVAGGQIWALDERRGIVLKRPQPIKLTNGPILWAGVVPGRDGQTIFADGQTRRGELAYYDLKQAEFKPLLGGISAEFATYSKDGKSLVYVSFPDGILWKADRDGSHAVELTEAPIYPSRPRWSPDGAHILFSDGIAGKIYTVPSSGGSLQNLLPEEGKIVRDPEWSPDGKKFVFARGGFRDPKNEDLCIEDLSLHQMSPLPGSTGLFGPSWSPDGKYIAAMAAQGPQQLRVFDVRTQTWRELAVNGPALWPAFSKDSRYVYFMRVGVDQGFFRIGLNGEKMERVVNMADWHFTGFWGFTYTLDPMDQPIVTRDVGTEDIYALTLDDK